jgi:hypothetical protein
MNTNYIQVGLRRVNGKHSMAMFRLEDYTEDEQHGHGRE